MSALEENLQVLRRRNPELAERIDRCATSQECVVLTASTGAATVQVEGRLEASHEDPEAEGRRLAAHFAQRAQDAGARRVALFGLGVHTLRFLDLPNAEVLVIEPSLALCRAVLERIDLAAVLERIHLVCADEPAPALRNEVFRGQERGLFLSHPAARRRAARLHDELASRFPPGGTASPLNIAVIPPLYGGSLPVALACARALRELGHYVRDIDLTPFWPGYELIRTSTQDPRLKGASEALRAGLVRLIGEGLLSTFQLDPPDLVFAIAQAPLDADVLHRIGQMGITRAFWFCEDFHVMPYWRGLARCYDTIFHVQPGDFSEPLRATGAYGIALPMAFDPAITHPLELNTEQRRRYACDVSFVGAGYHNRRELLPALFDLGLKIWGTDWPQHVPFDGAMPEPNARQSSEASNLIFNASRINLNLHSSPWCDGVNPAGDYLNPRTFELAGARSFQLVDERRDLTGAFVPGIELETYRDVTECRKKIEYYLAHEDERREIAANGYRRALAEHTYRHRMEIAVDALRAGPAPLAPRRSEVPTVRAVLESAQEEAGLCAVLSRLEPERVMDAQAITLAVARGDGELCRDELLLLYMREVLGEVRFLNEVGQTT